MLSEDRTVVVENLTKNYGRVRGIEGVTFDVRRGEVFGLLGPNGAGKTTAIRTLVGLIRATSGTARILNENALVPNLKLRARIGYLPGIAATYDNYSAWGYLRFISRMRKKNLEEKIAKLATRLDLDLETHIHDLSKGNRQKVSVVQAFMHDPEVFFLDEPTSGLDPLVQREFEMLLEETRHRGASVILSSHVLSEVEHLADRVAIFNLGRVAIVDEIAALKAKARRQMELHFPKTISAEDFKRVTNIKELQISDHQINCVVTGSELSLLKRAVELGVTEVRTQESSLEEIFLDVIGAR